MYLWSKQGDILSSELDLASYSDELIYQYMDYIDKWKLIKHPLVFDLSHTNIKKKITNRNTLLCELVVTNINLFSLLDKSINIIPLSDKLSIVRNIMSINELANQYNLEVFWHTSMLRISKSGHSFFLLPEPPQLWQERQKNNYSKMSIIYLLLDLFNINYKVEKNILLMTENLEKKGVIPWGSHSFIKYYLNNSGYNDTLFYNIFHKIGLYRTANRLAMSNKVLNTEEYNRLHRFGEKLGLSNQQMNLLDVISQKDKHQKIEYLWVNDFLI